MIARCFELTPVVGRGLPQRHHPRRCPGGGSRLQHVHRTGDVATVVKLMRVAMLLP